MTDDGQMSFWEHLDALRAVLFRIVALMAVIAVASFAAMPWLFDHVIMAPCSGTFVTYGVLDRLCTAAGFAGTDIADPEFKVDIVSLELASQLFVHMSTACWTALLLGFPALIYMLWGFVAPGLYEHERRGAVRAFFFGNIMFYLGIAVGYFMVFPLAVRFLADYQLSGSIRPIVSLDSYIDNFFMMLVMMGAVFELPLLAWILGRMGLLTRSFFGKYRRHAIVVLLIVAALITPTGDPFTLFIVFLPIYALWELSARLVPRPAPAADD